MRRGGPAPRDHLPAAERWFTRTKWTGPDRPSGEDQLPRVFTLANKSPRDSAPPRCSESCEGAIGFTGGKFSHANRGKNPRRLARDWNEFDPSRHDHVQNATVAAD